MALEQYFSGSAGYNPNRIHTRPRNYGRRLARYFEQSVHGALPHQRDALGQLAGQANQSRMSEEGRAAFLAPRLGAIDQAYARAGGYLDRNLAQRGMDTSSAAVQGWSGLEGARAAARGNTINSLFATEDQRQLEAQQALRQYLTSIVQGQGSLGLSAANSVRAGDQQDEALRLQRQAMEGPGLLDQIFGGLGGLAGIATGIGWQPFARKPGGSSASRPARLWNLPGWNF